MSTWSLPQLLAGLHDDIERRLRHGIRHRDADRLKREIEAADLEAERKRVTAEELEDARERQEDLSAQIERCRTLLEASRKWTRFEAGPFRDALSCSLELLGAEDGGPHDVSGVGIEPREHGGVLVSLEGVREQRVAIRQRVDVVRRALVVNETKRNGVDDVRPLGLAIEGPCADPAVRPAGQRPDHEHESVRVDCQYFQ